MNRQKDLLQNGRSGQIIHERFEYTLVKSVNNRCGRRPSQSRRQFQVNHSTIVIRTGKKGPKIEHERTLLKIVK